MRLQISRVLSCAAGFSRSHLGSASSFNQHSSETNRKRKRIALSSLTATAALVLLSLTPKHLHAQPTYSAPYYAQPGYPSAPYSGQYAPPVQRPTYAQPQYAQQPYAQPYPQQPYPQQPSQNYSYNQPYPQQTYPRQQPYPAPAQNYSQQYSQQGYDQSASSQQFLNADQLEQLVAPIALYPDTLVAQVLAASTYPAQVSDADRWLQSQGNASSYQIAGGADGQNWGPSVKALTAFPQVLDELDRNQRWTTDLGNAYYNQPQDVLEAVQVMRQRAQAAGNLQSTPQEQMNYDQGAIELAPPNPQTVYVPQYNPWNVYGDLVSPYQGFSQSGDSGSFFNSDLGSSALQFGLGIAMSAFNHTPWGSLGWDLNWLTPSVLFNHSNYATHSTSVTNWGLQRGGMYAFSGRGGSGYAHNGYGYGRTGGGYGPPTGPGSIAHPRDNDAPTDRYTRPAPSRPPTEAFNRGSAPISHPQNRLAYGPEAYGGAQRGYANPMQTYHAPTEQFQRNDFGRNDYGGRNSNQFAAEKAPKSGGFHLFGGGGSSNKEPSFKQPKYSAPSFKEPRMPKMSSGGHSFFSGGRSGGSGHSSGGGHSSAGHGGGHHH